MWYRSGSVSVTNGSTTVTGASTDWIAGVGVGEAFNGPDGRVYEIASIVSATQLTLGSSYLGSTATGQSYQIIPSQSYIRDLASQAAQLVADYAGFASNAGAHMGATGAAHGTATASAAGFMSAADKTKLDGVATNANNYAHPANHPPSIITQDAENRFVTDAEKTAWNGKEASGTAAAAMSAHASAADPHPQYALQEQLGTVQAALAALPDAPIRLNPSRVTADFTVPSGYNAASVGPIAIAEGVTVTVQDNAVWSVH